MEIAYRVDAKWRHGPPVEVVESPKAIHPQASDDVRGAYVRKGAQARVYLVAGQPPEQEARTLAHEALGHHAPRVLLGAEWRHFAADLNEGAASDPQLAFFRGYVRANYPKGLRPVDLADEVLAHAAEYGFDPDCGQYVADEPRKSRLSAALRSLGRRWLHLRFPATYRELEGVVLAAERHLQRGSSLLDRLIWGGDAPPMAKPMGPKVPARDLQESEALLSAARSRDGWLEEAKLWGLGISLVLLLGLMLWGAFDAIISLRAWLAST